MTFNDWTQYVKFGSAYEPTVASVRFTEQYKLAKFQEQEQARLNQEKENNERVHREIQTNHLVR